MHAVAGHARRVRRRDELRLRATSRAVTGSWLACRAPTPRPSAPRTALRVTTTTSRHACQAETVAVAWVVRSGRYGERDDWALMHGYTGGGWHEVPDLTECTTREEVAGAVAFTFPDASSASAAVQTGQVWAMRGRIAPGDLMVMPLKTTKRIALGRVLSGYHYLSDEPDTDKRHVLDVDWIRTDLPRTAVKQDLLYTLGSALSIFAPTKNGAVARLEALLASGVDPGQTGQSKPQPVPFPDSDVVDQPESDVDTAEIARDRITTKVNEEFKGHGLAELVGDILTAQGFTCAVSPPGPDHGIDIVAGKGPLGIDSPRVIVQVKSGGVVGSPVVNQLNGVINQHNADQGLLVAWEGMTSAGRDALKNMQLRIALWEASDVIDRLLAVYSALGERTRARIPLRQVWMLAE